MTTTTGKIPLDGDGTRMSDFFSIKVTGWFTLISEIPKCCSKEMNRTTTDTEDKVECNLCGNQYLLGQYDSGRIV